MTPADLPAWFDGLPEDIRELLVLFGDQGFEDAAAVIGLISEDRPERPKVPAIKINNPQVTRSWPYDGPEGRARLTGSLDTGGSFTGDDDDDDYYRQSDRAAPIGEGGSDGT